LIHQEMMVIEGKCLVTSAEKESHFRSWVMRVITNIFVIRFIEFFRPVYKLNLNTSLTRNH